MKGPLVIKRAQEKFDEAKNIPENTFLRYLSEAAKDPTSKIKARGKRTVLLALTQRRLFLDLVHDLRQGSGSRPLQLDCRGPAAAARLLLGTYEGCRLGHHQPRFFCCDGCEGAKVLGGTTSPAASILSMNLGRTPMAVK